MIAVVISGGISFNSIFTYYSCGNHLFLGSLGIEVVGRCGCSDSNDPHFDLPKDYFYSGVFERACNCLTRVDSLLIDEKRTHQATPNSWITPVIFDRYLIPDFSLFSNMISENCTI